MLNYETALALKEAGFPQEYQDDYEGIYAIDEKNGGVVYVPTLSELIAAVDDCLLVLERFPAHKGTESYWFAYGEKVRSVTQTNIGQKGETPEMAVANLYLALHEKKRPEA